MAYRKDFQEIMETSMLNHWIENEKTVTVFNFHPGLLATDQLTKKRMISGMVYQEDETYCLTLITNQSSGLIKKIIFGEKPFYVEGVFSKELFTGQGGEVYRPLIGRVRVIK